jgi:hypothetical protein
MQVVPNPRRQPIQLFNVRPRDQITQAWDIGANSHWYDFTVTGSRARFERRIAGHGEDGRSSFSDPNFGKLA